MVKTSANEVLPISILNSLSTAWMLMSQKCEQALVDGGGVPALVRLLGCGGELATAAAGVLRELCALRCGRVSPLLG